MRANKWWRHSCAAAVFAMSVYCKRCLACSGMSLAGGTTLTSPMGSVASANLTPDASGISYYDEALFIQALRTGTVKARQLNPTMPYSETKFMTDDELKAVFAYLRTVAPVKHRVDNGLPPTFCKLCQSKHGAGDQN
jgi:hypothetical protein